MPPGVQIIRINPYEGVLYSIHSNLIDLLYTTCGCIYTYNMSRYIHIWWIASQLNWNGVSMFLWIQNLPLTCIWSLA